MFFRNTLTAFIALLAFQAFAQTTYSYRLTPEDLQGMEEKRYSVYDENTLWGYINGGADIYLEYGLNQVFVQDLSWQGEPFKVDAYVMKTPEAAFGVFSVSRFGCAEGGKISAWECIGKQQVQIAVGDLYLSVISYSGTEKGNGLAQEIAKKIVEKINSNSYAPPSVITKFIINQNLSSLKLITGQLAMQNAYPNLEEIFVSVDGYKLWVVPFELQNISYNLLLIKFSSEDDLRLVNQRYVEHFSSKQNIIFEKNSWMMVLRSKSEEINSEYFRELMNEFEELSIQ